MMGSMAFCISGGKQYRQQRAAFWAGLCICRQHCAVNGINVRKIIRCLLLPQFAVRQPGQSAKMEFEYIRHGTTSLIGFFDVATGRMEMPYLNSTRTEEDFVEAVKALTETDPQAPWTFICDGLNTHKSEAPVRFVAEACVPGVEPGKKGKTGILKSMKSRADFLHDPSHRIRFVYTPKHSSWMNRIEIWFGIINRKLLKRKSCLSTEELEASILRFIEQYNLTAHPFKWTYAGIPLAI